MSTPFRRRDFITLLGGAAAAWPLGAGAQQQAVPVVGYLYLGAPEESASFLAAFRKGLSETGYVEGSNVAIEYRFAHNDYQRLPEFAADLVRRQVAVIAASNISAGLAAKAATTIIPVVVRGGGDPVEAGLVTSLNRPDGNVTGINSMTNDLGAKRLGLLHELLPVATRYAVIVNPNAPRPNVEAVIADAQAAGAAVGKQVDIVRAGTSREIDAAFASLVQNRADALMVTSHPLFVDRRVQIATLAARYTLPAIYSEREIVQVGGLMSYGPVVVDTHRLVGIYVGRILKGEKPANLPVMRPTKFEFIINMQTARTLGIDIPPVLLAIADEVIE